jgi:hypothetical protein
VGGVIGVVGEARFLEDDDVCGVNRYVEDGVNYE